MSFLDLNDLISSGDRHACEDQCAFCGAVIKASHEDNCALHPNNRDAGIKGENCECEGVDYVFLLDGKIPIKECPNKCDEKIMKIIETLLPQIAEKYPAFLRKRAKLLEKTADGLDEITQALNQDKKG